MDENEIQEVLAAFSQWFRSNSQLLSEEDHQSADQLLPPVDLFALFGELRGLREDVKRELRRNANFFEEFRGDLEGLRRDSSFDSLQQRLDSIDRTAQETRNDLLTQGLGSLLEPVFDLFDRTARSIDLLEGLLAGRRFRLKLCGVRGELEGYLEAQRILQKKYSQNLRSLKMEVVGKKGEAFDPLLMTAIGVKTELEKDSGTILEVVRHGFVREGKALRCAEVVVSKKN